MKRFHIAIATNSISETVDDYTVRLGAEPCLVIPDEYALWRTDSLNVSIRKDLTCKPGELRHLGWEDQIAKQFSQTSDVNGIVWEHFSARHQADEIINLWPESKFSFE